MEKMNRRNRFGLLTIIALLLIFFAGCAEKGSTDPQEEAPEIPPLSTFLMDFNSFDTTSALPKINGITLQQQDANWRWAGFKVGVWNLVITVNLAIPVAAFVESFQHEPVQQSDGSWIWAYNFGIGNSAKLRAFLENNEINWEMRITKPNQYTDFLWFTGVSNLVATEGTWQLNVSPNDPKPYLDILWHRNPQQGSADVRYTNVIPNNPGNGGYIFYGITNDTPFNAFYDIWNVELNNLTNIEWNRSDFHGHITDPLHFGDTNRHCWDTLDNGLIDITCQ
ncbi:MAG: hypothetical protein KDH95_23910 [Calditrichaeota bacterium]|nr:hypothetical protein [Calditrichota bacterium]